MKSRAPGDGKHFSQMDTDGDGVFRPRDEVLAVRAAQLVLAGVQVGPPRFRVSDGGLQRWESVWDRHRPCPFKGVLRRLAYHRLLARSAPRTETASLPLCGPAAGQDVLVLCQEPMAPLTL